MPVGMTGNLLANSHNLLFHVFIVGECLPESRVKTCLSLAVDARRSYGARTQPAQHVAIRSMLA